MMSWSWREPPSLPAAAPAWLLMGALLSACSAGGSGSNGSPDVGISLVDGRSGGDVASGHDTPDAARGARAEAPCSATDRACADLPDARIQGASYWAAGHELLVNLGRDGADSVSEDLGVHIPAGQVVVITTPETGAEPHLVAPDKTVLLLRDIEPGTQSSELDGLVSTGKLAFFRATGASGRYLWRTDGTPDGTFELGEIGPATRTPIAVGAAGLVFFRRSGELWASDGTQEGTTQVAKEQLDEAIDGYVSVGGVWLREGEFANTHRHSGDGGAYVMVDERETFWLPAGAAPAVPLLQYTWTHLGVAAGVIASGANEDGRTSGCFFLEGDRPLRRLGDENVHRWIQAGATWGEKAYFVMGGERFWELWESDGTYAGTRALAQLPGWMTHGRLFALRDQLVAVLYGESSGVLYAIDRAGTLAEILDTSPNGLGSDLRAATLVNGRLYFVSDARRQGLEPWVTDGTADGTYLLADIVPGEGASSPSGFSALDEDTVIFSAEHPAFGREIWETRGKSGDARLLADLNPGSTDMPELTLLKAQHALVFAQGGQLWASDATARGTRALLRGPRGSIQELASDGTHVFALARPPGAISHYELWVSRGNDDTTRRLGEYPADTCEYLDGGARCARQSLVASGGRLFWARHDQGVLVVSDGTPAGTATVSFGDKAPSTALAVGDGVIYFGVSERAGEDEGTTRTHELWRSDGTTRNTKPLGVNLDAAFSAGSVTGDRLVLLLQSEHSWYGGDLRSFDLQGGDPQDLAQSYRATYHVHDPGAVVPGGFAVLVAEEEERPHRGQLTMTSGTHAGTRTYALESIAAHDVAFGSSAVFMLARTYDGRHLTFLSAVLGAEAPVQLSSLYLHRPVPAPLRLIVDDGTIYFGFGDTEAGSELWVSDGSSAGTQRLADVLKGPASSAAAPLAVFNGRLVYAGSHPYHGRELWSMPLER